MQQQFVRGLIFLGPESTKDADSLKDACDTFRYLCTHPAHCYDVNPPQVITSGDDRFSSFAFQMRPGMTYSDEWRVLMALFILSLHDRSVFCSIEDRDGDFPLFEANILQDLEQIGEDCGDGGRFFIHRGNMYIATNIEEDDGNNNCKNNKNNNNNDNNNNSDYINIKEKRFANVVAHFVSKGKSVDKENGCCILPLPSRGVERILSKCLASIARDTNDNDNANNNNGVSNASAGDDDEEAAMFSGIPHTILCLIPSWIATLLYHYPEIAARAALAFIARDRGMMGFSSSSNSRKHAEISDEEAVQSAVFSYYDNYDNYDNYDSNTNDNNNGNNNTNSSWKPVETTVTMSRGLYVALSASAFTDDELICDHRSNQHAQHNIGAKIMCGIYLICASVTSKDAISWRPETPWKSSTTLPQSASSSLLFPIPRGKQSENDPSQEEGDYNNVLSRLENATNLARQCSKVRCDNCRQYHRERIAQSAATSPKHPSLPGLETMISSHFDASDPADGHDGDIIGAVLQLCAFETACGAPPVSMVDSDTWLNSDNNNNNDNDNDNNNNNNNDSGNSENDNDSHLSEAILRAMSMFEDGDPEDEFEFDEEDFMKVMYRHMFTKEDGVDIIGDDDEDRKQEENDNIDSDDDSNGDLDMGWGFVEEARSRTDGNDNSNSNDAFNRNITNDGDVDDIGDLDGFDDKSMEQIQELMKQMLMENVADDVDSNDELNEDEMKDKMKMLGNFIEALEGEQGLMQGPASTLLQGMGIDLADFMT